MTAAIDQQQTFVAVHGRYPDIWSKSDRHSSKTLTTLLWLGRLAHRMAGVYLVFRRALQRDGFGKNPAFETKVAIINDVVTGYAVYYWGYDTDSATRVYTWLIFLFTNITDAAAWARH